MAATHALLYRSGEKVNEFSTVSHDSRRSGHRKGHSGPPPHADEGMAQQGECHCPLKGEISMCKAPVTQGKMSHLAADILRLYIPRIIIMNPLGELKTREFKE